MLGAWTVEGTAVALLRLLLLLLPAIQGPGLGVAGVAGAAGAGLPESVIWAVNAGGEAHVDVHGIHFRKDPLEGRVGRASDYGMKLPILRSNPEDQILYQTERYNEETFGYEVPIKEEGDYVLVLKFAEVYFAQSQQKMYQSFSLIQDWRRKKRKKKKKNMMKGLISKNRPIRTGCSQAPAHPTPMPRTTAASCFPSWWPSESSFQPSSASAGCENK
ncbi:malectin isoform X4 [Macaca nemestrina]|uniref:Malectin n=3 Tax=Cercopithecinae TaxID=9528 RepID=A0A2K5MB39_CERAT|nr:PREDICTED: malectin isoform X3 [Cercocebus atys]XP_015008459.1 malectin isoform X2 [Macaca mulatta]XP_017801736.1 malectin isoform X2 [Papio anubis]XP_050604096.1 malectin isoform X2 [Macaca thibetana thibetana]